MKVPAVISPIAKALKPAALGLAAVGVGAVNAQVGGALAKAAHPSVAAFAARTVWHEAAVDGGAGAVLDTGVTVGVGMWKGARTAALVAPLLLIGTAASAIAPAAGPRIAQLADKLVGMLMPSSVTPGGFLGTGYDQGSTVPGGFELGSTIPGGNESGGTMPGGDVGSTYAFTAGDVIG